MAGYSGTPLAKKLGIKSGYTAFVYHPPEKYFNWLELLPSDTSFKSKLQGEFDFIHLFAEDKKTFEKEFSKMKKNLKKTGMIWGFLAEESVKNTN